MHICMTCGNFVKRNRQATDDYLSDLNYPRCTNSLSSPPESDCGSTTWAFVLFIAWNVLSMVRFSTFICDQ